MSAHSQWLRLLIVAVFMLQSQVYGGSSISEQFLDNTIEGMSDDHSRSPHASKHSFLDLIGLSKHEDPYIQQSTQQCIQGDLANCFKAKALRSFDDFFDKKTYKLSDNALVVKVESQARTLAAESLALDSQPRSGDSDWDALVKYGMRKVERFLKSTALELQLDDEMTSNGLIAPRFINEMGEEINVFEGKTEAHTSFKQMKKFIIPTLLILKLFKLKLLLFLPLILGMASVKKFLAFVALIIPGVIGYFKFCNSNSSPFSPSHYSGPQYSSAGIGLGAQPAAYIHGHHLTYANNQKYDNNDILYRDGEAPLDLPYKSWDYRSMKNTDK